MSLYTDIRDAVFVLTSRPRLTAETDVAIAQAVRKAHRANTFYRDLVTLPVTGVTAETLQTIDLSAVAPDLRAIATVEATGADLPYTPADVTELFDPDGYRRNDVYYLVGSELKIRAAAPAENITITYYRKPTTSPIANLDSWIAERHPDVITLWAAATVLALVGEQEIKTRIEGLARLAYDDLIAEELITGVR
jgi:hypothetical protein